MPARATSNKESHRGDCPVSTADRIAKFSRFFLLGGVTYCLATGSTYIFVILFCLSNATAYALTQLIVFSVNFLLARRWVFQSTTQGCFRQALLYLFAASCFRFADWLLFMLFMDVLSPPYFVAIFLSLTIIFPTKFFIYDRGVFKK
jgi:putative flippase GtrA